MFPYADALKNEIRRFLPEPRWISSIFFGGGTPSYLPVKILTDLLSFLKEHFLIKPDAEITIEVNPGTINSPELDLLRSAGFNRLSIGLQAWQDQILSSIGRIHSVVDFLKVYQLGRTAGFSNLGVDIIFGLPGQTIQDWAETLAEVTALQPEHISAYGLQLESGTELAKNVAEGLIQLPSEDEVVEMMGLVMDYLPNQGYQHYEISNYAKPGFESVHNLGYWQGDDYLGFGAGAYSTVAGERWYNLTEPWKYIDAANNGAPVAAGREKLDQKTKAAEALMLGLRLRDGVDLPKYEAEYGINLLEVARPYLTSLMERNLVVIKGGSRLVLTKTGIMLSNSVISSLLVGV